MSNAVMPLSDYVNACDTIREKTNSTDTIKSGELANKIDEVYESGKASGGGDSYYDAFWDAYQQNGERVNYRTAFADNCWNDNNLIPKYDIVPTFATDMFRRGGATHYPDKINIDFSKCTEFGSCFNSCVFREIGIVDMRSAGNNLHYAIYNCGNLTKIEKVILKENQVVATSTFADNPKLESITFEGVIVGVINFGRSSKLSKSSIQNMFSCLSNTATEQTLTLSKTAVNNAFETSSGLADGSTSQEWLNLVATKTNWTISLV